MDKLQVQQIADNIMNQRHIAMLRRYRMDVDEEFVMEIIKTIGNTLCYNKFVIDGENREVYDNVIRWLAAQPFEAIDPRTGKAIEGDPHKGLYIAGGCGTGKSMLLTIIAGLAFQNKIKYEFAGKDYDLCWADQRTDELCNQFILDGAEVIKRAKDIDVLCLNDLASEPQEQMYMGNRVNVIRQILEARADRYGQMTLITSNYPINHSRIKEWYGDRVASRLNGMCNYMILNGKDRRQ